MDIGEFVASERATCKACDKPAGPFCGRCAGVKYCSKVFPHPSTCKTIINATCRNVRQVTGKHTNSNALSSKSCEGGILIDGITLIISVTSKLIVSDSLVVGFFFLFLFRAISIFDCIINKFEDLYFDTHSSYSSKVRRQFAIFSAY